MSPSVPFRLRSGLFGVSRLRVGAAFLSFPLVKKFRPANNRPKPVKKPLRRDLRKLGTLAHREIASIVMVRVFVTLRHAVLRSLDIIEAAIRSVRGSKKHLPPSAFFIAFISSAVLVSPYSNPEDIPVFVGAACPCGLSKCKGRSSQWGGSFFWP